MKTVRTAPIAVGGALALLIAASSAAAQTRMDVGEVNAVDTPTIALLADGSGHIVETGVRIDDDSLAPGVGIGLTLFDGSRDTVTLWGDGFFGRDFERGNADFYGGSIGLAFRSRFDADSAFGVNAFFDAGDVDQKTVGAPSGASSQVGLGLELEETFDLDVRESLRFGLNGYLALDDDGRSTAITATTPLPRAAQSGGDAFIRYGRDFAGFGARYDLTVAAFGYDGGDIGAEQFGGVTTLGLTIWQDLPEGVTFTVFGGPRYATAGGGQTGAKSAYDVVAGLGLSYAFGGSDRTTTRTAEPAFRQRFNQPRDCVLVADRDGEPVYDCSRPVIHGGGGVSKTGEPLREVIPAPRAEITVVEAGGAPSRPIRHLGYGTAFVPTAR